MFLKHKIWNLRKWQAVILLSAAIFSTNKVLADSPSDLIKKVGKDIAVPYVQPLVTSIGTAMGGGLFHTANAHESLGFDIGIKAMIVPIPDEAKTFEGTFDVPVRSGGTDVTVKAKTKGKAQTVLGENKETDLELVSAPSGVTVTSLPKIPGGINLPLAPLGVLQASVGIYKGTEIMVRGMFLPAVLKDDLILAGGGIKWEFTDIIPGVSEFVNIAPQFAYQILRLGEVVNGNTLSFNIHASTDFIPVVSPYLGIGFEKTSFDLEYEFEGTGENIQLSVDGKNGFRATFGLALRLAFIRLNFDYNIGEFSSFTGGLAISIR